MRSQLASTLFLARTAYNVARSKRVERTTAVVGGDYGKFWDHYGQALDKARTLDEWLWIEGDDNSNGYFNVGGKLEKTTFNSTEFYRQKVQQALTTYFANAKSITEFGCGLGRNLLYLKKTFPHLDVYGYELVPRGVEIAREAAKKFGVDAKYAVLDYVNAPASAYVHPITDVAFTMFSLEQLPHSSGRAMQNILARVKLGTIHLEPVAENYPLTLRGLLGRYYTWKVDYLRNFDREVKKLGARRVRSELIMSAHNVLMFPSLYVVEKAPANGS